MGNDNRRKGLIVCNRFSSQQNTAQQILQVEKAEKEKNAGNAKFKEGKYGRLRIGVWIIYFVKFLYIFLIPSILSQLRQKSYMKLV